MKILYFHQYFATRENATGTRSYEMARRWVAAGHEVHMITTAREGRPFSGWRTQTVEGIQVHWLWVPYKNEMGTAARVRAFLKYALKAGTRAVEISGDCLFATSTPLSVLFPGLYARWRLRKPFIFEVRDLWPTLPVAIGALKNPLMIRAAFQLESAGYRTADRIIALSPDMVPHIVKAGGDRSKIVVAPNSCDSDLFQADTDLSTDVGKRYPFLKRADLVVYTGTLGQINGVGYLAEIARKALAANADIDFLVVGEGRERERVEKLARQLRVWSENFWIVEPVPKTEVVEILREATVATSLFVDIKEMWVNSANKFFDALAAGRPVMINYRGWQAKLLTETGAGIVVPPDDATAAARVLMGFVSDTRRVRQSQRAALELARNEFDRDKISYRVLSAISAVSEG